MTDFELIWAALKGVAGGIAGYLAQRMLKASEERLESLYSLPRDQTDIDLEEVLGDFIQVHGDKMNDASGITVAEGCQIIGSGADTCLAYFRLKVVRVPSIAFRDEKEEEGG